MADRPLCHKCYLRPAIPSKIKYLHYYICSKCYRQQPYNRRAILKRYHSSHYRHHNRNRELSLSNPLRYFYRVIGLESYYLSSGRLWNGKVKKA